MYIYEPRSKLHFKFIALSKSFHLIFLSHIFVELNPNKNPCLFSKSKEKKIYFVYKRVKKLHFFLFDSQVQHARRVISQNLSRRDIIERFVSKMLRKHNREKKI